MNTFLSAFKEYKVVFKFWVLFLLLGLILRLALSLTFLKTVDANLFIGLLYGFRMDTIFFSFFGILFSLLYALNFIRSAQIFFTAVVSLYVLVELLTFGFMSEFLTRPNSLFIEHLKNYNEIFSMIWGLYKIYIPPLIAFIAIVIFFLYKFFQKNTHRGSLKKRILVLPLILVILFLGVRSSVDMSTPNQSFYTFSSNDLNNEIANNSTISILYSLYLMKKEKFYRYGDIDEREALKRVQALNGIQNSANNLERFQKSTFMQKKNIVLVILESFGHEHIGYLGGTPTTPILDSLTKESLYFTNLYAVGTRTSWGVSSISTSLYPIPSREYVKASKSQKEFYTIALTLQKHNYETTFLYSGDANFDNMRGFLQSNGYDNVYGKESFSLDKQRYTWGYNDEDLFEKAFDMLKQKGDKPYFLTLLTLSSHEPFDYPKNRVSPYKDAPLEGFANSIKYADYAIGEFIARLKENNMMKDTVIAFVADHCSHASGSNGVPIDKYKIAAMIVADEFKGGKRYNKIASQIDIAPTLLDIAGISDTIPTMGSSVLQNERDSALLLANKRNFAYLTSDKYTVYKDKKKHQTYNYKNEKIKNEKKVIDDGLSYIYASKYLYENRLYH